MRKALTKRALDAMTAGADPLWFAELDLAVLNAVVDSQADWEASKELLNIDTTSRPGFAVLATIPGAFTIDQPLHDAGLDLYSPSSTGRVVYQDFYLDVARPLRKLRLRVDATGAGGAGWCMAQIVSGLNYSSLDSAFQCPVYTVHTSFGFYGIADGYVGDVTAELPRAIVLPAGRYWIRAKPNAARTLKLRYKASDVYAGGKMDHQDYNYWYNTCGGSAITQNVGDLCFTLTFDGFAPRGRIRTKRLDLGETPRLPGQFLLGSAQAADTVLDVTLEGFAAKDDASPAVTIEHAADGQETGLYRFWEMVMELFPNGDASRSPVIDIGELMYALRSVRLRPKDKKLLRADPSLAKAFAGLMVSPNYAASEIRPLERVASRGTLSFTLEDPTGETIDKIVADSPLKNHRARVMFGFDWPGFTEADLVPHFAGIVKTGKAKPRYDRPVYGLEVSIENPLFELTRKVPSANASGSIVLSDYALSYDGTHLMDAAVDLMRNGGDLPARWVDLASWELGKLTVGDGDPAPSAYVVRRSAAAGLPDTRLFEPEELRGKDRLEALAFIADGYVVVNDENRIAFVKHDKNAAHEATWADAKLVKAGLNAVPIYDMDSIDLGYERLANAAMMGCEWNGSGNEWLDLASLFAHIDEASVEEFAPGAARYLKFWDKGAKEAGKWLGPEAGYNGAAIARSLVKRLVARHAWPPVVCTGAVVPQSELRLVTGAVIRVISDEVKKFRRRRISAGEIVRFLVLKIEPVKHNNVNRAKAHLLELT